MLFNIDLNVFFLLVWC